MNVATDFPWTGTGGLSDIQSYDYIILDWIFDHLSHSSFYSGFACKRISSALPIEAAQQIPFLGVFLLEDTGTPDGDLNAGTVRFIHNFTIGVQVIVKDNDPTSMRTTLDRASWFALNQVLRNNDLTNRYRTKLPDNVTFEGFPRLRIVPDSYGLAGSKNETALGSRLFLLTFLLRTVWAPTDFPDLERITITTAFPTEDYTPGEIQQVKVVYEFTPDSVPTPLPPDP